MADVSKFVLGETTISVKDSTARANQGNLSSLNTSDKTSLVAAINELKGKISQASYTSQTETITL